MEITVQHLARLATEVSAPPIVTPKPSTETSVPPEPPIEAQEDSDVDLETGEISVPTLPVNERVGMVYQPNATIEDCKAFATVMLQRESAIWYRNMVALHPDLVYEFYFQDYQHLMDLRQKGNARIQSFNVKVTRQETKLHVDDVASSKANREKLEIMFRTALYNMHEAFEPLNTPIRSSTCEMNYLTPPSPIWLISLLAPTAGRATKAGN